MSLHAHGDTDHRTAGERVLVVDDHPDFRRLARALLEAAGYRVVGEAGDGDTALARARELQPDIVLLDVQMPGRDGIAVAEALEHDAHPPAVVLVSARPAEDYGDRLRACGAAGFIPKQGLTVASFEAVAG